MLSFWGAWFSWTDDVGRVPNSSRVIVFILAAIHGPIMFFDKRFQYIRSFGFRSHAELIYCFTFHIQVHFKTITYMQPCFHRHSELMFWHHVTFFYRIRVEYLGNHFSAALWSTFAMSFPPHLPLLAIVNDIAGLILF